jgi:hypothetical protein
MRSAAKSLSSIFLLSFCRQADVVVDCDSTRSVGAQRLAGNACLP